MGLSGRFGSVITIEFVRAVTALSNSRSLSGPSTDLPPSATSPSTIAPPDAGIVPALFIHRARSGSPGARTGAWGESLGRIYPVAGGRKARWQGGARGTYLSARWSPATTQSSGGLPAGLGCRRYAIRRLGSRRSLLFPHLSFHETVSRAVFWDGPTGSRNPSKAIVRAHLEKERDDQVT